MNEKFETFAYEHSVFKSGQLVYIDSSLLGVFPKSPIAGKVLPVVMGTWYTSKNKNMQNVIEVMEEDTPHMQIVTVRYNNEDWHVHESYVSLANENNGEKINEDK